MIEKIISNTQASYADLKRAVSQLGLLNRQPLYYTVKIFYTLVLLVIGIAVLIIFPYTWVQIINALFLGFVFGQLGFLSHDFGHQQVFSKPKQNNIAGYIFAPLILGMSYSGWVKKHDEHHAHPNEEDHDPDIDIPFIAFSRDQLKNKKGFIKWIVKYQAILFFPLLFFEAYNLRIGGIKHLLRHKSHKYWITETVLFTLHFVWYVWLIFGALPLGLAITFIILHQGAFGVYLGMVFAPNHKGMPMLEKGNKIEFMLRQIMTARNVLGRRWVDFMYGGLNFQIEHHLFPRMPRNKLRKAQKVIEAFCRKHNISYYSTSVRRSLYEILAELHHVSAPLRQKKKIS